MTKSDSVPLDSQLKQTEIQQEQVKNTEIIKIDEEEKEESKNQTVNVYEDINTMQNADQVVPKCSKDYKSNSGSHTDRHSKKSIPKNPESERQVSKENEPYSNKNLAETHTASGEELSLSSHRLNNEIENRINASLYGKPESSARDSKSSANSVNLDWTSTGLWKLFNLQYQEHNRGHPLIKNGELVVTRINESLSDFIYRNNASKKSIKKSQNMLNDIESAVALKFIKKGLKVRLNKTIPDDSSDENKYQNQSDYDFALECKKYFEVGIETLRYLMNLLGLIKNYSKIASAYSSNNYEDVMKCLLR